MFNEVTILVAALVILLSGIVGLSWYYGIFIAGFIIICLMLLLLILIQKGKSSMGIGNLGGGNQMLFGGTGGQDIFQKTTWVLGLLFMSGSLLLAMAKRPSRSNLLSRITNVQKDVPMPVKPDAKTATPSSETGA